MDNVRDQVNSIEVDFEKWIENFNKCAMSNGTEVQRTRGITQSTKLSTTVRETTRRFLTATATKTTVRTTKNAPTTIKKT